MKIRHKVTGRVFDVSPKTNFAKTAYEQVPDEPKANKPATSGKRATTKKSTASKPKANKPADVNNAPEEENDTVEQ